MDSIYHKSKWMDSPQQDQMLELFQNSPIRIDWNFHNSQKVEGKQLVFGPWAGPLQCITHIMHEMAHLVEIDDKRILKNGWGLTTPTQYIPGRYSYIASMPTTCQPILRECRVIAMQWQLQTKLGIEETPREALSSLKYMPDWCNIPCERSDEDSYKDYDEKRYLFLENKMLEYTRSKYTLNFFFQEWKRKNNLLKKAMKS